MDRLQAVRDGARFVNPALDGGGEAGWRDFLKWRRERVLLPDGEVPRVDEGTPAPEAPARGVAATWVGHATALLQVDGRSFLTDPIWSDRAGGVVKRRTPPGIGWRGLPRVDALLVSHNHYDHLDAPTINRLPRETPVYCPLGVGAWFRGKGFRRVHELGWWQGAGHEDHRVTLVPAQHFSGRTPWDRNRALWGGFVVEGPRGGSAYFAGDSGYFPGFAQIGAAFPGLDLALIPVGAYEPRWFMAPVHVDPPEAGRAFLDTGARHMVPIHWGAFRLADEPIHAPPEVLARWWGEAGVDPARLHVLPLGGYVRVPPPHRGEL